MPGKYGVVFRPDEQGFENVTRAVAYGVLNACHAVEGAAKAITPVHGDPTQGGRFSTFAPGEKPIGGTLRRSIHSVVLLHGRPLDGSALVDANKRPVPYYRGDSAIEGYVGTNVVYAAWVHDGTVKMRARPFLSTAFDELRPKLGPLIEAGARKYLQQGRNR